MLGIVVGLVAEARLAAGLGGRVAVGGGGADGAAEAARSLVAAGVTGLVSFGLAGGLAPGLAAGAIVVPDTVTGGGRWSTDPVLSARLGRPGGILFAAAAMLATRAEKEAAHRDTGADAVDLESGAVARAAAAGLPFAVLRAICDPAERDLPPAARTALDPSGRIRPLALAGSLLRHPGQVGALVALGREAALARAALLRRVAAIGRL